MQNNEKYHGWMGKVLLVNLTAEKISEESLDENLMRKFLGGVGLGIKLLYDEVLPGIDAFDPDNPLIVATGPCTGTAVPGSGTYAMISKSPTSGFTAGMGTANGFLGARLKWAGYDGIIFRGASKQPVYLCLDNGKAELRDADKLWGKDAQQAEGLIREEFGNAISVACIGIAGENLVRFASVYSDEGHVCASGGAGAVMGKKGLKAIAVHGTGRVRVAEKEKLLEITSKWRELSSQSNRGKSLNAYGTAGAVPTLYNVGDLPIKNLSTNIFPEYEKLSGQYIRNNFKLTPKPCYGCHLRHAHTIEVTEGAYKGFIGEEPEYESMAAWGSNLGISDTGAVVYISNYADKLGMDAKAATWVVSLCMECYEKGILNKNTLDGLELNWGNVEATIKLLEKIARREGIGNILAEGARRAAEYIGGDAPRFAVHIKSSGIHVHDLRSVWGAGLAHVITNFAGTKEGAATELAPDPDLGYVKPLERLSREGHAQAVRKSGNKDLFFDCAGTCCFLGRGIPMGEVVIKALNAITGENFTLEEVYNISERVRCLARAFAVRHGLTPADDWPSPRLLEPPKDGGAAGAVWGDYLKGMVNEYYGLLGWDEKTGKPLRTTLKKLHLDYVIKDIWS